MTDWKRHLRSNLDLPAMRGNRDDRAIQEMADHLEDLYRDALASGCSEQEAEARARAWLDEPGQAASEIRSAEPGRIRAEAERWVEREEHKLRIRGGVASRLADLLADLRLGLRRLGRRPLFAGVVVLVLALGIGATTAIYSLVRAVVLAPLPFVGQDRLVAIHHAAPELGTRDAGQCAAWHLTYEEETRAFERLGMYAGSRATITGAGDPEAVFTLDVTQGVFPSLRVNQVLGRAFGPGDHDPDGQPTVMLGHAFWQSRFGGDPAVVGQVLRVDGAPAQIIGVMPQRIAALGVEPAIIRPLRFRRAELFIGNTGFGSVARLRDGVTLEQATAELARALPMAWKKFPGGPVADWKPEKFTPFLRPLKQDFVGPVSRLLWVLLAGAGVVFLIACANVANLMLVHAEARNSEMAVRVALGAGRGRLALEYLKESLLLGIAGGVVGLALGQLGLHSVLAIVPSALPRADNVRLDSTVLLLTAAFSLGTGLLFGWLPARRQGRRAPVEALKESGRSRMLDRPARRTQTLLAVSQVALVLVLLVANGLMLRSFWKMSRVDPGFREGEHVLALQLYIPRQEVAKPAEVATTFEAIYGRLAALPGVDSAGLATAIPMDGFGNINPVHVEGQVADSGVSGITRRHKWIAGGYLETLQIPLIVGRTITWDDVHSRAPVALLSERLARELFGTANAALGRRIAARPDPPVWKEVVGVVADVREDGMAVDPPALVYWPHVTLGFWQGNAADQVQTWRTAGFALRGESVSSPAFQDAVQKAIWQVSPNLPVLQMRTLDALMASSTARTRFSMILLCIASGIGLVLGVVGVYGVISYGISQRTGEIGMRMVLGAEVGQVERMILGQGLMIALAGVGVGLAAALGATRLMSTVLFGVAANDPLTYASVTTGTVAVALLASYVPARRAARVDPVVALRAE